MECTLLISPLVLSWEVSNSLEDDILRECIATGFAPPQQA